MVGPASSGITTEQRLWAEMLAEKKDMLFDAKADKMLKLRDFASTEASLTNLRSQYASRRTYRCLDRMTPVLDKLKAFEKAISAFIQSDPTYSSLVRRRAQLNHFVKSHDANRQQVWGGILICMEVSQSALKHSPKSTEYSSVQQVTTISWTASHKCSKV